MASELIGIRNLRDAIERGGDEHGLFPIPHFRISNMLRGRARKLTQEGLLLGVLVPSTV